VLASERVHQGTSWIEALSELLLNLAPGHAETRHHLREYLAALQAQREGSDENHESLRLLLRRESSSSQDARYHLLSRSASLKDSLAGKTIIEFPTVFVVLPPSYPSFEFLRPLVMVSSSTAATATNHDDDGPS